MTMHCRKLGGLVHLGWAAIAISLTAGAARGQTETYDASGRTRLRYGMARDVVAVNQESTTTAGTSTDAAPEALKTAPTWQPRRTYESPRSGSRASTSPASETK